eukprot:1152133-Rhodomonas_salina.3
MSTREGAGGPWLFRETAAAEFDTPPSHGGRWPMGVRTSYANKSRGLRCDLNAVGIADPEN